MKQRESFESSLLSAFSVFLNFSPKPTHSDTTDDKEGEKNERRGFFKPKPLFSTKLSKSA